MNDQQLFVSVISLAEICKGIAKLPESKKRTQPQEWLDSTLRPWFAGRVLPVTEAIAERMGRWAGEGEAKGRNLKMADGLIAATAWEHDLTLVTRNVRDFAGVPVSRFSIPGKPDLLPANLRYGRFFDPTGGKSLPRNQTSSSAF